MNLKNHSRFVFSKLLVIAATCLTFQSVHATVLFQEGFIYTSGGNLGGKVNPGSGDAWNPGNNGLTIGSGSLTYPGLQNLGGNDLSVAWATAGSATNGFTTVTSGQIYYSFLLDVTTIPGTNAYLTSLNPGTTTPNGSSDAINAYIYANGKIELRTAGESAVAGPTLSLNTTYLVVLEYDFATTTANLFLNPTAGGSQPAATVSLAGSGTVTSIDNVGFKSQATTGDFLVDNLLIGTTWTDVTPVPEPSALALAGFGLLGFAARFRRGRE
ncbi:MAG: PEP-CTERM sorting domain-containing protein [Verrucomicrobiota bacterium]|jgi:hypothetical protein